MVRTDGFGNAVDPELSYATGDVLAAAEDQYDEALEARRLIRRRWEEGGADAIFNFSGLERGFPADAGDLQALDDETAPALYEDRFTELLLDHFGGDGDEHDAFLANRMTAATVSTFETLVDPGQTVVGAAPNTSHASVVRAADLVDAAFHDTTSADEFVAAFDDADDVGLVALSRMDVTYEIFDERTVDRIVSHATEHDVPVYMDDAGGARVAPALFGRRRSLELDVDVVSTGLDKYGVSGPRFGALAGDADLVRRIRSQGWKLGLEARPTFVVGAVRSLEGYDPDHVRNRYEATVEVGEALRARLGDAVGETTSIVKLTGEDVLRTAMDRAGVEEPPLVPIEATGALSMLLLRDYGVITVHFVGIPSGTPDFLLKFMPPDEIERFGGPDAFAAAVDDSISELAMLLDDPDAVRELLLG
jgi:L-seryl-tRNA(Ser) seleniumtransferase